VRLPHACRSVHAGTVTLTLRFDPSPSIYPSPSPSLPLEKTGRSAVAQLWTCARAHAIKHQQSYREREACGNSDGFGWMDSTTQLSRFFRGSIRTTTGGSRSSWVMSEESFPIYRMVLASKHAARNYLTILQSCYIAACGSTDWAGRSCMRLILCIGFGLLKSVRLQKGECLSRLLILIDRQLGDAMSWQRCCLELMT
jgi:hypothetical protein